MAVKLVCPDWFDDEAINEWNRMTKIIKKEKIELTEKDIKTFEAYCRNYSKWKQCEMVLKDGLTFTTPNGYIQQRPEESISNKAQEKMLQCAKELGLTPAARARMGKNLADGMEPKTEEEKRMEKLMSK